MNEFINNSLNLIASYSVYFFLIVNSILVVVGIVGFYIKYKSSGESGSAIENLYSSQSKSQRGVVIKAALTVILEYIGNVNIGIKNNRETSKKKQRGKA